MGRTIVINALLRARGACCAGMLLVVAALGVHSWAHARSVSAHFTITVNLQMPDTGQCRSTQGGGTFGAAVTVVCATGAAIAIADADPDARWQPTHGGAYRFLTHVTAREQSGTVDTYAGIGTTTGFRLVSSGGRDYVEMTVGW